MADGTGNDGNTLHVPDNAALIVQWNGHHVELHHTQGIIVVDGVAWDIESLALIGSDDPMRVTFWTENGRRYAFVQKLAKKPRGLPKVTKGEQR